MWLLNWNSVSHLLTFSEIEQWHQILTQWNFWIRLKKRSNTLNKTIDDKSSDLQFEMMESNKGVITIWVSILLHLQQKGLLIAWKRVQNNLENGLMKVTTLQRKILKTIWVLLNWSWEPLRQIPQELQLRLRKLPFSLWDRMLTLHMTNQITTWSSNKSLLVSLVMMNLRFTSNKPNENSKSREDLWKAPKIKFIIFKR